MVPLENLCHTKLRGLSLTLVLVAGISVLMLPSSTFAQDARRELARIRAQIQQELRSRPEVQQAFADWDQARTEYLALKSAVTYELTRNSTYLSLRADMWAAEDELQALQHRYRNGVVPAEDVQRLAHKILELRMKMSQLEIEALTRHDGLLEAREAYIAAGRRLSELRREMSGLLRADPRLQGALDRLSSAGRARMGPGNTAGSGGRRP